MKLSSSAFTAVFVCAGAILVISQSGPKSSGVDVHIRRAEAALRSNDQQTAIAEFRAVLSLDPKHAEAHSNLGVIEFFRGDCKSAVADLRQAVNAKPSLAKPRALLGICEKRLGDPDAQKDLAAAFAKLDDPKLRTRVGLELAELYQQSGDLEHVTSTMAALVALNPEDPDILYFTQRTYSELAEDTLNKLAIIAPGSARMQQTIAERLVNNGDLKNAIDHYRKALELDPKIVGLHYELAEAVLEAASSDSAAQTESEKELQAALIAEGDNSNIECELGRIATLRSDLQGAYNHYLQAFQLDSGNTQAQLGLGRTLMTMSKPQEARKYLEMAVKSDPLNNEAHYRLGLAYRNLQMAEQAQREMQLFQEIKKTKEQVRALYRQMNREPRPEHEETANLPGD